MSYHVRFENVGRDKKTWECDVPRLDEQCLIREARKALMSRGIWFDLDDAEYGTGEIYAGMHAVGSFTFWKRTDLNSSVEAI